VNNPVLILAATSGIGAAVAEELAREKHDLILAGRNRDELEKTAADLKIRFGVAAGVEVFDAIDFASHPELFARCIASAGRLQGVVLCQGFMAAQAEAQTNFALARQMIDVNYTSAVSLLNLAAEYFEARKAGFICAVSSVAGDRGRQSNYLYGSTKAALSTYLEGLYVRLWKSGVAVVTIKPGFVDTRMTRGLPGIFLVAQPSRVARDICAAIRRRKRVKYTPWFWWGILSIVCAIPTFVFRRMKM
jgi:short-subunit dehydrogenase